MLLPELSTLEEPLIQAALFAQPKQSVTPIIHRPQRSRHDLRPLSVPYYAPETGPKKVESGHE